MMLLGSKIPPTMRAALRECRPHLLSVAGFSALVNILYLAPTIYMMQVYDRVVPTGGISTLLLLTLILGITLATLALLDGIRSQIMVRASLRLNEVLSGPIFKRLLSETRAQQPMAGNAQALREFDTLRQAITGPAMLAAMDAPWTPIYLFVATILHPLIGLLIAVGGLILIGLGVINERAARGANQEAHRANIAAYAVQDALNSRAEVIRALGMQTPVTMRQKRMRQIGLEVAARGQLAGTRYSSLVKFFRLFLQSLALGGAAWLAIDGKISTGAIIAASVLLSRALQPIEQLVAAWPIIVNARTAWDSLCQLLAGDGEKDIAVQFPDPKGQLSLTKVSRKAAQGDALIVNEVSFAINPGEVVAMAGPSGAGKSTLARIAAGAIHAGAGEVRIDGARVEDWDAEALARHIGYLPQDNALLTATIAENISRFARDRGEPAEKVDQAIIAAAQLAGIHEMILKLPNGYGAQLGGAGFALSGGQAQRVALARALYGNPKLLILDEPNSALDAEGERCLIDVISAAKAKNVSVLLITHRTQLLGLADRLIILNDGQIAQDGPCDVVLRHLQEAGVRARQKVIPITRVTPNG